MELNQKLAKHYQKTLNTECVHRGKYLHKNLGVKEGGGCLLKGGIFSGTYSIGNVYGQVMLYVKSYLQSFIATNLRFLHWTPASSWCEQLWMPTAKERHSISLVSLPLQDTLSRKMDPVPWPKKPRKKARAPIGKHNWIPLTVWFKSWYMGGLKHGGCHIHLKFA